MPSPTRGKAAAQGTGLHVEAAGIVIVDGGYKRAALDVARDFIRAQMEGAWDDVDEDVDAEKLAEILAAYGSPQNAGGHIIAPLTHGGSDCICEAGTEAWCRAIGCPRRAAGRQALAEASTRKQESNGNG